MIIKEIIELLYNTYLIDRSLIVELVSELAANERVEYNEYIRMYNINI